jgi:hypothetical protein
VRWTLRKRLRRQRLSIVCERADRPHRNLVFHGRAWRWTMTRLLGSAYHLDRPELADPHRPIWPRKTRTTLLRE